MTKEMILAFLTTHKEELHERYGVERIGLFGSYARDEATPQSDIDLVVDMPSSFKAFFGLQSYLQQHLEKKVDLGMEKRVRSFIREQIQHEVIYV